MASGMKPDTKVIGFLTVCGMVFLATEDRVKCAQPYDFLSKYGVKKLLSQTIIQLSHLILLIILIFLRLISKSSLYSRSNLQ